MAATRPTRRDAAWRVPSGDRVYSPGRMVPRGSTRAVRLALLVALSGCGDGPPAPPPAGGADAGGVDAGLDAGVRDSGDVELCARVVDHAQVRVADELRALEGVRVVTGTLTIEAGDTLAALGCLERVGGDLVIRGARELTTLAGLQALTEVGGAVRVEVAPALTDVDLPALARVGGDLHLDGNRALERVRGLARLETVGGRVTLTNNPLLRELDALPALTRVGGLTIAFLPALEVVAGLEALRTIDGPLSLYLLRAADLRGLARVTAVRGDLELGEHVGPFGASMALARVDGELRVDGDQLTAVELPALAHLGGLRHTFGNVQRIALPALTAMTGDVVLRDAPSLEVLALPALETTTGTISVRGNPRLTRVELGSLTRAAGLDVASTSSTARPTLMMPALRALEGPLMLEGLDLAEHVSLARLEQARTVFVRGCRGPARLELGALSRTALVTLVDNAEVEAVALPRLEDSYDLSIVDHPELEAVELPALAVMGGRLTITGNPRLTALSLPALGGRLLGLTVADNAGLTTASLPRLTDAGTVTVRDHAALTALSLPRLGRIDRDLVVVDNAALDTCAAERLRDQVLAARGIGGRVEITGNATCP